MKRVSPSERTKEEIGKLLREGTKTGNPKSELVRLGIKRVLEEVLEAGVRDLLGREYYERRSEGPSGYRNGSRRGRLKTTEGEVVHEVPQVRGVDGSPLRELRAQVSGRTEGLEGLVVEMFARGCSTRDIEALLATEQGEKLLSRTAVSEITEALWREYEEFVTRDLSDVKPLYLFLDGIAERLRPGAKSEAILCAWAITEQGRKVLVHLAPGTKESTDCCRDFLEDLKRRGLGEPVLVITDGAAGLMRAVEECFSLSLRQRCLAHKMRNLLSKVPPELQEEVKQAAQAAYQAPSPAVARALREDFVGHFGQELPTAVRCFEEDFEACIAHLYLPPGHRRAARTTNLLERLFVEERRRTRAVGTLFGERPVLKLMFGALIRASESWRPLGIETFERHQLERLREALTQQHRRTHAPVVNPDLDSAPNRISSKKGT